MFNLLYYGISLAGRRVEASILDQICVTSFMNVSLGLSKHLGFYEIDSRDRHEFEMRVINLTE